MFLRLGENSAIRMLSTRLTDTRVEVLSGSAIVESNEIPKDNAIELVYKKDSIRLQKQGLYRLDTEPAHFQVYEGEAMVTDPSGQLTLKGGKQTNLAGCPDGGEFRPQSGRPGCVVSLERSSRQLCRPSQYGVGVRGREQLWRIGSGYGGSGYGGYGLGGLGLIPWDMAASVTNPAIPGRMGV